MSILLVDDSRVTLLFLENVLKQAGYRDVRLTESLQEAVAFLEGPEGRDVRLILLDVHMPEVDGIEGCARLKQHPAAASIPVIVMSAAEDRSYVDASLQAGAAGFLAKPMTKRQLTAAIRKVLDPPSAASPAVSRTVA